MNGKNILFISYDGMTDPLGQSQVIPYLQGMSKAGYTIFLLSCEKQNVYVENKTVVGELLAKAGIHWIPLKYTKKPPVISTLIDIFRLRKAARSIHKKNKLHLVHTRPGVPALVGLWMKKKTGVKFLNDIREFYADSRVEGGMWDTSIFVYKMIYRFFKQKESEAVAASDGIVCLTYTAEKIIKKWPAFKDNIPLQVIPCSVDLALFDPSTISTTDKTLFKKELDFNEADIVFSYLGSIGGWYLTDEMMRFFKMLCDEIAGAKILFISPHRHEDIRASASRHGIPQHRIRIRKATRKDVPKMLSLSDYSVFFIRPCYSKLSSSPTKHGEIMAMGIPLITNSGVGDVETIVNRYNAGIVINGFSSTEFKGAVQKIVTVPSFSSRGIREGAMEFYSLDKAIEKYKAIYKNILGE